MNSDFFAFSLSDPAALLTMSADNRRKQFMGNDAKSCWACRHQQIGGDSFLGLCRYFDQLGKPPKAIPPHVVDVACKYWERRVAPASPAKK